jgi:hypothetical protein
LNVLLTVQALSLSLDLGRGGLSIQTLPEHEHGKELPVEFCCGRCAIPLLLNHDHCQGKCTSGQQQVDHRVHFVCKHGGAVVVWW